MNKYDVSTLDKLKEVIEREVASFAEKQIVLFEGPLGSGKTQSVRYIVEALNGGDICSPSFSIHNIYESSRGEIDHIDLYRLEDTDDIESTGFWDLFEKESGLILIEWANYIEEALIPIYWKRKRFQFELETSGARNLIISEVN